MVRFSKNQKEASRQPIELNSIPPGPVGSLLESVNAVITLGTGFVGGLAGLAVSAWMLVDPAFRDNPQKLSWNELLIACGVMANGVFWLTLTGFAARNVWRGKEGPQ